MDFGETLSSYLPGLVLRRFAGRESPTHEPELRRFPAAALFGDISGFTRLTEQLAQRGPAGAEELNRVLCAYFEQLIDIVNGHGGDVVKFAGDGVLALWEAEAGGDGEEGLANAACLAAQCSLALQEKLHRYPVSDGLQLSMHIGLGAGEISGFHLGGGLRRWELLVAGPPLRQVAAAVTRAKVGEVVASPETWTLLAARCEGTATEARGETYLRSVREPLPLVRAAHLPPAPAMHDTLRGYLPGAIRARLAAGQSGWLAELRRVSVIFVNLPDLDESIPLDRAQAIMETLQTALYHYEGSVGQLAVDDKGITLVAALGLPPLAHENDPLRAIQAAQTIREKLRELGVRSSIGVTTGRIFCGTVGSALRREYTTLGDTVNLAARLMQKAPGDILCDQATFQAARGQVRFDALPALTLKGKAEPVPVFRPLRAALAAAGEHLIVGRTGERETMRRRLAALAEAGESGVVLLEGEAGIGKSRLVAEFHFLSAAAGVRLLAGAADAVERSAPYYAWRPVFAELFALEGTGNTDARRAKILERLQPDADLVQSAPLLNPLLSVDFPDNELTSQMAGQVRADNTNELLLRLLLAEARRGAFALVIEDAHWLDSASWGLLLLAARQVQPALMLIATRPPEESSPGGYRQLLDHPGLEHVRLGSLGAASVLELVCRRLGVPSLPPPVAALIQEKAAGNPFFSEEMAYALRDAGLIQIADGECAVAPGVDLSAVSFPDSVQGVIISRVDRLSPSQQLTLKVASVIGRTFAFQVLHDVYPPDLDRADLGESVDRLQTLELTLSDAPEPKSSYIFKHAITQEVAYNLMLFAQRRQLHRAVANWYERSQGQDLAPYYPLLAHHWSRAEDREKALDYLGKAGEQTVRGGAYHEAIEYFTTALKLDASPVAEGAAGASSGASGPSGLSAPENALRRVHWENHLSEAYLDSGRMTEGREHSLRALAGLGRAVPASTAGLLWGLAGQVLVQVMHRLRPASRGAGTESERTARREAAIAYERFANACYFEGEKLGSIHAILSSLNVAEKMEPSPELLRGYAAVGLGLSFGAPPKLAFKYCELAERTAASVDDVTAKAFMREVTGVCYSSLAQWARARASLSAACEITRRLGDRRRQQECLTQLAIIALHKGEFALAEAQSRELLALTRTRPAEHQAHAWALIMLALSLSRLGRAGEATAFLEEAAQLRPDHMGKTDVLLVYGCLSVMRWRLGRRETALQAAGRALEVMRTTEAIANWMFEGIAGTAETFLEEWQVQLNDESRAASSRAKAGEQAKARRDALEACAQLRAYARPFPAARPRARLLTGNAAWLDGNRAAACKYWLQSLTLAQELEMPYEQARALYRLGCHSQPGDAGYRPDHLARAEEIFKCLGAAADAARIGAGQQ